MPAPAATQTPAAPGPPSRANLRRDHVPLHEKKILAMNEALVLGALRQHELTAATVDANALLRAEIVAHKRAMQALHRAQRQLKDRAGQLEGLVCRRTMELTATNRRLEASVDAIGKGKEEIRLLLVESQNLQQKLSLLTRRILTTQEEERKRISRELHDDLQQTLVRVSLDLSLLGKTTNATTDLKQLKKKIAHTQRILAASVAEVHRFARELRPAELDDFGLVSALHVYSKNLAAGKNIRIRLAASDAVETLGAAERTALFRVAQEALTNVVRHARATQAQVSIGVRAGGIQMEISDNGRSFRADKILWAKNPRRLGLVGMRERIEGMGGSLAIESAPGQGTTVRAAIPFSPPPTKAGSARRKS